MINYHMREKRDMVKMNQIISTQDGYAEAMRRGRVKKSFSAIHKPDYTRGSSPYYRGKVENYVEI